MPITTSATVIAKMATSLVVLIGSFISKPLHDFSVEDGDQRIDCAARRNCYSRSLTHSKQTKTKALSTFYDDSEAQHSIFSEEDPNSWIPTSPSVSVKKWGTGSGTNPRERRGERKATL